MATVQELLIQYENDPELKKEVEAILEDGQITVTEFLKFANDHDLEVSLSDFPKLLQAAKEAGLIK